MLKWRLPQTALVLLHLVFVCDAHQGQRLSTPQAVTLRLIISVDGDVEKAANVTVELMDAVGSSSALDNKFTDNDGLVIFRTLDGLHRYRITGPRIQAYEGEVRIMPNETSHVEHIRVRHSVGRQPTSEFPSGGLVAAASLRVSPSARKTFEKGSEAMRQQRWQESLALFETAIREYPQFDLAYDSLGFVQLQLNDVDAARLSFSKAIEINPDFAGAYRNLARIASIEHKYEEADSLLIRSLSTDSLNAWALVSAANAELLTHKYEEAIAHARKAHTVPHSGLAGVHFVAALALEATQQPLEAVKEYQLYLEEDPKGRDADRARKAITRLSESISK
jgi:tetratricopeptide (TPR) repeat protein